MIWLLPATTMMVFETMTNVYFSRTSIARFSATQRAFAITFGCLLVAAPYLASTGIPVIQPRFWMIVSIHAVLLTAARILQMRAIARAPLSKVLPIMQLQLVFLLLTNPLMTNDVVRPIGWIGVLLTAFGIYIAQFSKRNVETAHGILQPLREMWKPGMREMLMVTVIFSVTSNLDKLAIQASNGPFFLVVIYSFMIFLFLGLMRYQSASPNAYRAMIAEAAAPKMIAGGLIQGVAIIGQVISYLLAPVPYVIAFKQLSIGVGSLWGLWVRKDRIIPWYGFAGILLSVAGAFIIALNR